MRDSDNDKHDFSVVLEHLLGRICNISPKEVERYFLRLLLFNKARLTSFSDLRYHDGIQYLRFHVTYRAMVLLSDDAQQIRWLNDSFSSKIDPLTEVFLRWL